MKNSSKYIIALAILYLAIALTSILTWPAHAMNQGFDPEAPTTKWFESLKIPPADYVSCCGKADAYAVDRYEKLPNGDYRVWIADGSAIVFPDGTRRTAWNEEIPIVVPKESVNKELDDLDNPTDHSWLFFQPITKIDGSPSDQVSIIYCFVRHPNGS